MKGLFSFIYGVLHERGITVHPNTLRRLKSQGLVSTVYSVSSSEGKLIIHTLKPLGEHRRQKMLEKVEGVSSLLQEVPEVPNAEVVVGHQQGEHYVLVQKMLPGRPAGTRTLLEAEGKETWTVERAVVYPQIEKILARVHTVDIPGYGWPVVEEGALRGTYKSWREFFKVETPLWLAQLEEADREVMGKAEAARSHSLIQNMLESMLHSRALSYEDGVLVHGDAINPSNILVEHDTVSGLLDWEWSLVGDPAWEFCDPAWERVYEHDALVAYAQQLFELKKERVNAKALMQRARKYRPLWLLWSCSLHAENPRGLLYAVLRDMLQSHLTQARS